MPVGIERVYFSIAEIANKDIAAKPAKGERRPRDTPGRIQRSFTGEAPQEMAVGVEHVDEAVASPRHIVVFCRVLFGIGDEQIAV